MKRVIISIIPILALLLCIARYKSEIDLSVIPASLTNPICTSGTTSLNPKFTPEMFKQLGIVDYPDKGYWEAPIRQGTMKLRIPYHVYELPTYETLTGGFITNICDYGKGYQIDALAVAFNWYDDKLWQTSDLSKYKNIKTQEDYDNNSDIFKQYIWKVELQSLSKEPNSTNEYLHIKSNDIFKESTYELKYELKHFPLIFYPKLINKHGYAAYGIKNTVDDFTGFPILVSCDMQQESLEDLTQEKINRLINRNWDDDYVGNFRFCTDLLTFKKSNRVFYAEIYLQNQYVKNIDRIYPVIRSKLKKLIVSNN